MREKIAWIIIGITMLAGLVIFGAVVYNMPGDVRIVFLGSIAFTCALIWATFEVLELND
jgi:hypothetical protein